MIQQFDDDIADEPDDLDDPDDLDLEEMSGDDFDVEDELEPEPIEITPPKKDNGTSRRPPPPLISISDISSYSGQTAQQSDQEKMEVEEEGIVGKHRLQFHSNKKERKRPIPGSYPPALSVRSSFVRADSKQAMKRCRVDMAWMGLDQIEGSIHQEDVLAIARSECEMRMFKKLNTSFQEPGVFSDIDLVFSDGKVAAHRLILAASSPLLHELLTDPSVDCLLFPDLSVVQGRTAVEALYSGSVVIDKRTGGSLAEVERCVRAFQEVGLLEQYTVQLLPALPAARPGEQGRQRRWLSGGEGDANEVEESLLSEKSKKEKNKAGKEVHEKELANCETVQYSLRSPKKGKDNSACDVSPKSREKPKNLREDCKKPRFAELTEGKVRERSGRGPREVVEWLMETGFLSSVPPSCRSCGGEARLEECSEEGGDGLIWTCCAPLPKTSLRENSIFQYSKESLTWIVRIILCWRENTSLTMCHQVL